MSVLDDYDDETLAAERREGREVVRWVLFHVCIAFSAGVVAREVTRHYVADQTVATAGLFVGIVTAAAATYGAYRLTETWLLKRAAQRGYLEETT